MTTARTIARGALATALAALTIGTAAAQPIVQQPTRRIDTDRLVVTRGLPLPEYTLVTRVNGAMWNPEGTSLLFAGALTDPDFLASPNLLDRHDTLPVNGLDWSPDGTRLLLHSGTAQAGSRDTLHLVEVRRNDGPALVSIPTGTFNLTAEFSPRGTRFVTSAANGLTVYDGTTGRQLNRFSPRSSGSAEDNGTERSSAPDFFDWSNDDALLLVGFTQSATGQAGNVSISILNGSTLQFLRSVNVGPVAVTARFNPSDNSRMLIAGDSLSVVNTSSGATVWKVPFARRIRSAQWRSNGAQIVTVMSEENTWQVWNAATGAQLRSGQGREALFSPDGSKLAVLNGTGAAGQAHTTITIHNAADGALMQTIELPREFASGLQWRPQGNGILAIGARRVHIWRVN